MGEIVFRTSATILALGAGDVGVYTHTCTLLPNWVYRLVEMNVQLAAPAVADINDSANGMLVEIFENAVSNKMFQLSPLQNVINQTGTNQGFQARNPSVTNDFVGHYTPILQSPGIFTDFIDASDGISTIITTLIDATPTTAALGWVSYYRLLYWNIQQYNHGDIWTPEYSLS